MTEKLEQPMNSISPVNGYNIKYREAEKLRTDVERFLNGNKPPNPEKKTRQEKREIGDAIFAANKNARVAKEERLKTQRPILIQFKKLFGRFAWKILSDELNGLITAQNLGSVYRGEFSVANKAKWLEIELKATEMIKAELKK